MNLEKENVIVTVIKNIARIVKIFVTGVIRTGRTVIINEKEKIYY